MTCGLKCHLRSATQLPVTNLLKEGGWVDIDKGDSINPNYRSRYVGREFRGKDVCDDLFAATPPIEVIKTLISLAASQLGVRKQTLRH